MPAVDPKCTKLKCRCASCKRHCLPCNGVCCILKQGPLMDSCDYYVKTQDPAYLAIIRKAESES